MQIRKSASIDISYFSRFAIWKAKEVAPIALVCYSTLERINVSRKSTILRQVMASWAEILVPRLDYHILLSNIVYCTFGCTCEKHRRSECRRNKRSLFMVSSNRQASRYCCTLEFYNHYSSLDTKLSSEQAYRVSL